MNGKTIAGRDTMDGIVETLSYDTRFSQQRVFQHANVVLSVARVNDDINLNLMIIASVPSREI